MPGRLNRRSYRYVCAVASTAILVCMFGPLAVAQTAGLSGHAPHPSTVSPTNNANPPKWLSGFKPGYYEGAQRDKFALMFWHVSRPADAKLRAQLDKLRSQSAFSEVVFVDVDLSKESWENVPLHRLASSHSRHCRLFRLCCL
jgi:hypothetical protein